MAENQQSETFLHAALDAWGDAVYRLALTQTRSAADAQDVAQEVFIRLLERTEPFESDEHLKAWLLRVTINKCRDLHLKAWLLRVTINKCRDLHRNAWRSRVESLDAYMVDATESAEDPHRLSMLADPAASPEDTAVSALSRNPVWDALALLPEEQQLAMHLRYVEECDEAQIARIMDCAPATVRTRLHRARKRLRVLMEAHARAQSGALASHVRPHTNQAAQAGFPPAPRAPSRSSNAQPGAPAPTHPFDERSTHANA